MAHRFPAVLLVLALVGTTYSLPARHADQGAPPVLSLHTVLPTPKPEEVVLSLPEGRAIALRIGQDAHIHPEADFTWFAGEQVALQPKHDDETGENYYTVVKRPVKK